MASIKVDYEGIESDISTLTTNVKTICDSLDKINDIEKIVPSSWQSPASEKYRSTVVFDLIARIAELKGSLTLLINLLVSISDNFSNLEGIIGSDLKSWYDDLSKNNNILDILNKNPKFVSEGIIDNDAISLPTVDENGNIVYKKGEGKFSTMPSHFKIDENGKLVYDGPKEFDTLDSTVSDVGESNNI